MSTYIALPHKYSLYNAANTHFHAWMKHTQNAFTFVELIVVLVIIAILATIGFVSYESYISTARDTTKISMLKDIHSSFGTHALKSRIPLPENKVDISASGSVFAYQGDFTQSVADAVGFKGTAYDDTLEIYPNYMLLLNQKDFQLLHYLEDRQSFQQALIPSSYAFTDYQSLFPKVMWTALGIMMDSETQEPLHLMDAISASESYDLINGTWALRAYYSQGEYIEDNLDQIVPDKSCKRILELWGARGNGVYTINPTWNSKVQVYCDMQIDGWGWTFVAFTDTHHTLQDLFSSNVWEYNVNRKDNNIGDNNSSYSIDASNMYHTEMIISVDTKDPYIADTNQSLLLLKYEYWSPWFYSWFFPCTGLNQWFNFKVKMNSTFEYSNRSLCDATRWTIRNSINQDIFQWSSNQWARRMSWMNGDSSTNHQSWVYVR